MLDVRPRVASPGLLVERFRSLWRTHRWFVLTRVLGALAVFLAASVVVYLVMLSGPDDHDTWVTVLSVLLAACAALLGLYDACDETAGSLTRP